MDFLAHALVRMVVAPILLIGMAVCVGAISAWFTASVLYWLVTGTDL